MIDRLPIDRQPFANGQQHVLLLLRNRPVRPGGDVQQVIAILAHILDDPPNIAPGRPGLDAFHVTEFILDRIVGLPDPIGQFQRRAALAFVVHDLAGDPGGAFGADGGFPAPFPGAVVIISGHADFERIPGVVRVHVEPEHVGMIFINGFNPAGHPVVHEFDPGRIAAVRDGVEVGPLRVVLIAARQCGDELEMKAGMVGDAGFQAGFDHGFDEIAIQVAVGSVVFGVEGINRAVPVGKAVVMLARCQHVFGAGLFEQRGPGIRIPLGRRIHRKKVLVAELGGRPVMFGVPLHDAGIAAIHVADIPFAGVSRHGVDAPVHHDAELAIPKPIRVFVVLLDGLPGFRERPGGDGGNVFQGGGHHFGRVVPPDLRAGGSVGRGENAGFFHRSIGGAGAGLPPRHRQTGGGGQRGGFQEFTTGQGSFHKECA